MACGVGACLYMVGCGQRLPIDGTEDAGEPFPSAASGAATGATVNAAAPPCAPTISPQGPQGEDVWRRALVDGDIREPASVAVDAAGNAFIAGPAGDTVKLSESGSVLWSKPFGSLVATDPEGNAIVSGTFAGTLALGPRSVTAAGGTDVYVAKVDEAGTVLYGVALGGATDESVSALAVGPDGSAVVSGAGLGTVKIDAAGRPSWKRDFFGALAVDSSGNVLATGALTGTASFGGDPLKSAGGEDVFVAKLDGEGHHLFSRRFGDSGVTQHGEAIAVDLAGDIVVSGVLDGTVDFGGGALSVPAGTCPAEAWCKQAGFVVKLDPSGGHVWSRSRAPVRSIPGLALDSRGHILASGAYPGDAPPYRTVLFLELDADGNELSRRLESRLTDAGAGHAIAVDRCGNVVWSLSVPTDPGAARGAVSILEKLAP